MAVYTRLIFRHSRKKFLLGRDESGTFQINHLYGNLTSN